MANINNPAQPGMTSEQADRLIEATQEISGQLEILNEILLFHGRLEVGKMWRTDPDDVAEYEEKLSKVGVILAKEKGRRDASKELRSHEAKQKEAERQREIAEAQRASDMVHGTGPF